MIKDNHFLSLTTERYLQEGSMIEGIFFDMGSHRLIVFTICILYLFWSNGSHFQSLSDILYLMFTYKFRTIGAKVDYDIDEMK